MASFLTMHFWLYAIVLGTIVGILLEFLGRDAVAIEVGRPAGVSKADVESTSVFIPRRQLIVVSPVRFGPTIAGVGSP